MVWGAPLALFEVAMEVMTVMLGVAGEEVEEEGEEVEVEPELETTLSLLLPPPPMGFCFLLLSREKREEDVLQQPGSGRLASQHQLLELHSRMASLPDAVLSRDGTCQ